MDMKTFGLELDRFFSSSGKDGQQGSWVCGSLSLSGEELPVSNDRLASCPLRCLAHGRGILSCFRLSEKNSEAICRVRRFDFSPSSLWDYVSSSAKCWRRTKAVISEPRCCAEPRGVLLPPGRGRGTTGFGAPHPGFSHSLPYILDVYLSKEFYTHTHIFPHTLHI